MTLKLECDLHILKMNLETESAVAKSNHSKGIDRIQKIRK